MSIEQLIGKQVGIIGVGQEGQAIARYLVSRGILPVIFDQRSMETWTADMQDLCRTHKLLTYTGDSYLTGIVAMDVIFRSPGFPYLHPALQLARAHGAIITSQTKWFFEHCSAKIIGITGTKGKGTTSSLIYKVLKAHHGPGNIEQIYLTGNIGKEQPLEFLDYLTASDYVVYELSSFQLQDLESSPHIGICLMVTSDHLDHHANLNEYHAAKQSIAKYQKSSDYIIYNSDYPASRTIGLSGKGMRLEISAQRIVPHGATIQNDSITIAGLKAGPTTINCAGRKLRGNHNLENIAAATLVASLCNIPAPIIEAEVNDFSGLEHRLEFVKTIDGVSYYNDSISTVPDTTIAAVRAFTEPVTVIVGGSDKGISMESLATFLTHQSNIKAIGLMGKTGKDIEHLLIEQHNQKRVFGPTDNLKQLVESIAKFSQPGDVVVLSPAAASFGLFSNYADRGNQFKNFVTALL